MLTNYVAPSVCEYIADCNTYESAITILKELYVKPQNEIYARHVIATRRQEMNKSIDVYLQLLKVKAVILLLWQQNNIDSLALEMPLLMVLFKRNTAKTSRKHDINTGSSF